MKRNQKLGWMVRWCSMEVNTSLQECLLCWRGCMNCLKVKNSVSITGGNLCLLHFQVFYNRSKLWVFRLCSNSWGIHSSDMMVLNWIIGFWYYKTTVISSSRIEGSKKNFWAFWPLKWDCCFVSECGKQITEWHGFISHNNKYLNKKTSM